MKINCWVWPESTPVLDVCGLQLKPSFRSHLNSIEGHIAVDHEVQISECWVSYYSAYYSRRTMAPVFRGGASDLECAVIDAEAMLRVLSYQQNRSPALCGIPSVGVRRCGRKMISDRRAWDTARMKALLLAAGRGSRLGRHTDQPKCLARLGERSLIERQIETLRGAGIDEIVVVTGYRAEMLEFEGIQYVHNPNWATTNMVETLFCAEEYLTDEVIVSC